MSLILVPVEQAENPAGSPINTLFPAGPWIGTIDSVTPKDIPTTSDGTVFAGYETSNGKVLTVRLGSNVAVESNDPSIGERKFFVDICVEDGTHTFANVDTTTRNAPFWQLQNGTKTLVNLAMALGAAELAGGNGDAAWGFGEEFVEKLEAGEFDGMRVGFNVRHRKTKSLKRPVVEQLDSFFAAE